MLAALWVQSETEHIVISGIQNFQETGLKIEKNKRIKETHSLKRIVFEQINV